MQGDSFGYARAAEELGVAWQSGAPASALFTAVPGYVHWPIGYPVWLSFHSIVDLPIGLWALGSNAVFCGLLVFMTYRLAIGLSMSPNLALLSCSFVAFSPAIVEVGWRLQGEALFSILFLLAITRLTMTIRKACLKWMDVTVVCLAVSAATLVRYMAVFLIPFVLLASIYIFLQSRSEKPVAKLLAMVMGSLGGVVLQGVRNLAQGSSFIGSDRYVERFTPGEVLLQAYPWLGSYWWPLRWETVSLAVALVVLFLVTISLISAWRSGAHDRVFVGAVWAGFWGMLLASIYFQDTSPVDWRFIHPVFPLGCVLVAIGANTVWEKASGATSTRTRMKARGRRRLSFGLGATLVGAIMLVMVGRLIDEVRDPVGAGATSTIEVFLPPDLSQDR